MQVVCISKPGEWRLYSTKEIVQGPLKGDICTVTGEDECGYLFSEYENINEGFDKQDFVPLESNKTKYVVKEVEVATTIRELEICQS